MKSIFAFISGLLLGLWAMLFFIGSCFCDKNWRHSVTAMIDTYQDSQ